MSAEDIREAVEHARQADDAPPPDDAELARLHCNDLGNAERFRARHGRDFLHVRDVGWHVWLGTHWSAKEGPDRARIAAHQTARAILTEAGTLGDDAASKRLLKHGFDTGSSGRLSSMLQEAVPYLGVEPGDLDGDPALFNTAAGTLVLRGACQLRPHARADRISKLSPVAYDPDADAPRWRTFLHRILPDPELRVFVQTWFGYALTGHTGEQVLAFFYGSGANGKSTLLEVVGEVMGTYATVLPFQSLLHNDMRGGADASPDLARLPGARLVWAAEPETGSRFSEALLKQLTGGDRMVVRHLRRDFFEFAPVFKLTLSGNNKPTIRGQDEGIWRRMLLVPFTETIPPDERRPDLKAHLLAEAPGILNWLLDGCRVWLERGLRVPEAVRAATETYRSESDLLGEFLTSCTRRAEGGRVQAKRLYDAYVSWARDNAASPITGTLFGRLLSERGYHKEKAGVMFYVGLELVEAVEPAAADDGPPPHDTVPDGPA